MQKVDSRDKMREFVEKEKQRLELRKIKIQEILSNKLYILWLQEFSSKYPKFTDKTWLYNEKSVSKSDIENINNLSLLYEGINLYAKENYIYPSVSNYGEYFKIKFNNIGYLIGIMRGQETSFFCKRSDIEDDFIDFNDILLNKKQVTTDTYTKNLMELSNIITYYYEQGVPIEAIKSTIEDTLWKINEDNFQKERKIFKKIL